LRNANPGIPGLVPGLGTSNRLTYGNRLMFCLSGDIKQLYDTIEEINVDSKAEYTA